MQKYKIYLFLLIFFLYFLCSSNKYIKNNNYDYNTIKDLYNNNKFYKLLKLYNYLNLKCKKNILYKRAMSNFYNKNYILAVFYFKTYYDNKINKKYSKVEGALYNYIYCLYLLSFDYNLDQENTYNAIYGIHEFITIYPNSDKISSINILLNTLLKKIQKKEFEIAKINYDLENYKSAFLNFKKFIIQYPNSELAEQAFLYVINAQIKITNFSLNIEMLKKSIVFYKYFIKRYPHYN